MGTKDQTKQWVSSEEITLKKRIVPFFIPKTYGDGFQYCQSIIFIDYIEKGKTMRGAFCIVTEPIKEQNCQKSVHDWQTNKFYSLEQQNRMNEFENCF